MSENIDFKGLAEVINKLVFNNLHNPPPTKYFDIIINPLYSKQLLQLWVSTFPRFVAIGFYFLS